MKVIAGDPHRILLYPPRNMRESAGCAPTTRSIRPGNEPAIGCFSPIAADGGDTMSLAIVGAPSPHLDDGP
jgi:hypothetical protein